MQNETTSANFTSFTGMDVIGQTIADLHGVSLLQIKGRQQHDKVLKARKEISQALFAMGKSYAEIGRWMKKDHSTIIHHCRRAE